MTSRARIVPVSCLRQQRPETTARPRDPVDAKNEDATPPGFYLQKRRNVGAAGARQPTRGSPCLTPVPRSTRRLDMVWSGSAGRADTVAAKTSSNSAARFRPPYPETGIQARASWPYARRETKTGPSRFGSNNRGEPRNSMPLARKRRRRSIGARNDENSKTRTGRQSRPTLGHCPQRHVRAFLRLRKRTKVLPHLGQLYNVHQITRDIETISSIFSPA